MQIIQSLIWGRYEKTPHASAAAHRVSIYFSAGATEDISDTSNPGNEQNRSARYDSQSLCGGLLPQLERCLRPSAT